MKSRISCELWWVFLLCLCYCNRLLSFAPLSVFSFIYLCKTVETLAASITLKQGRFNNVINFYNVRKFCFCLSRAAKIEVLENRNGNASYYRFNMQLQHKNVSLFCTNSSTRPRHTILQVTPLKFNIN